MLKKFQPQTKLEEALYLMEKDYKDLQKIVKKIIKKADEDPEIAQQIEESITSNDDIDDIIRKLKEDSVDIELLKQKINFKEKLDTYTIFHLKKLFARSKIEQIADKMHYSSKWMSVGPNDVTRNVISDLRACPKCGFELADWANKCQIARSNGIDYSPSDIRRTYPNIF